MNDPSVLTQVPPPLQIPGLSSHSLMSRHILPMDCQKRTGKKRQSRTEILYRNGWKSSHEESNGNGGGDGGWTPFKTRKSVPPKNVKDDRLP